MSNITPTAFDKIRTLIGRSQVEEAIEAAKKIAERHRDLLNTLIVLENQQQSLVRGTARGILEPAEASRQRTQIATGLLDVVGELEKRELPRKKRRTILWIMAAGLLILGSLWFQLAGPKRAESTAYRIATEQGTVQACTEYLHAYPDGEHAAEIRQTLSELNRSCNRYLQSARAMQSALEPERARAFADTALQIRPGDPEALKLLRELTPNPAGK